MRVKITLSYDGSRFDGFQIQPNPSNTVANTIDKNLKELNIPSKVVASGRTDKGVHAIRQVIHLDIPSYWSDIRKLKNTLNKRLSPHIYIKKIENANDSFHARFDAKKRVYRYIASTKEPNPFESSYATFANKIDQTKIKEAIKLFEGTHDLEYFKKSCGGAKNHVRTIYKTRFYKYKEYYVFYFEANGFLRSQIRMMVGFLLKISSQELTKEDLEAQLSKKKLINTKPAPPNGLYLARVKY